MREKDISPELRQRLLQFRSAGKSLRECSAWLSKTLGLPVGHTTVDYWLSKWTADADGIEPKKPLQGQVAQDKVQYSQHAEASLWKRKYQELLRQSAGVDEMVQVARELTAAIPAVPVLTQRSSAVMTSAQTAVAPLCDTHIGEEVSFEQMGGLNQYNMEVFNRRLHGWADQVINLTELRRHYVAIPKLVVPLLGDMVSGDIHLELTRTNLDNVMGQMIRGAHMIAQALVYIAPHFAEIQVPCVVGNHGRMTTKPPAKDKYVDWDYLLYQWTAAFCRNQPNIHFEIPKSFMHVFQVEGRNILIMHGDSVQMWQSIPYYGILRAIAQLRQVFQFRRGLEEDITRLAKREGSSEELLSLLAAYFDTVMIGHFHRHDELDIGTGAAMICGCLKGGDEFSLGRLHTLSRPKQIVTYWHPKYGYLGKDLIYLERYDDPSFPKFVDALPDVWVNTEV